MFYELLLLTNKEGRSKTENSGANSLIAKNVGQNFKKTFFAHFYLLFFQKLGASWNLHIF